MNEQASYLILLGVLIAVIVYALRDGLLIWLAFRWGFRTAGGTPPVTGTTPPVVLPPPVVVPVPVTPRFTDITATSFGGPGDSNASAYGGMVNPNSPGVALPYHFTGTRPTVRVFYKGKSVDCSIVDVGPWNTNDPYWQTGTRPQAESGTDTTGRTTNLAGIDLTPAAWTALGVSNPNSVKAKVDWDFVYYLAATPPTTGTTPPVTTGDPPWLAKARSLLGFSWSSGNPPPFMQDLIHGIMANAANKDVPGFQAYCTELLNGYRPWCGMFAAGCLAAAGKPVPFVQGDDLQSFAWAPAWDTYGTTVVGDPQAGDIMRFGWHGGGEHVTFYEGRYESDNYYHCLGGNQSNAVTIAKMIMDDTLKAVRRPPT